VASRKCKSKYNGRLGTKKKPLNHSWDILADYSMNRANESQTQHEHTQKKKKKKKKGVEASGSMASINRL
jgi:hypothetical protein